MVKNACELGAWVEGMIRGFVNESPENSLRNEAGEKAWGDPLVGFSSGADPLYDFYKEDIGTFFLTPVEWFEATFPQTKVREEELTVISWILPQTEATKAEHRLPRKMPTERWARARICGEAFNEKLRGHIVKRLNEAGYTAISPMLSLRWSRETSEKYGFASNWSERHAAYASGLGTFGLCDGLITPRGKAMRAGSVITRMGIQPSERRY
jgi:epoxyqueuosine reductase